MTLTRKSDAEPKPKNDKGTRPSGSSSPKGQGVADKNEGSSHTIQQGGEPLFFYEDAPLQEDGRLRPFLDAISTGVIDPDEQEYRNARYETVGGDAISEYNQLTRPYRPDEEVEEKDSKPKTKSRSPASSEEGDDDYSIANDLFEGSKEYGNHLVRALNEYGGFDLDEFTRQGELRGWGNFISDGTWTLVPLLAAAPVVGALGGGMAAIAVAGAGASALEIGDTALQATRPGSEIIEGRGTGVIDPLADIAISTLGFNPGEENHHILFGEITDESPFYQKFGMLIAEEMLFPVLAVKGISKTYRTFRGAKAQKILKNQKGAVGPSDGVRNKAVDELKQTNTAIESSEDVKRQVGIAGDAFYEHAKKFEKTRFLKNIDKDRGFQKVVYNLSRQQELAEAGLAVKEGDQLLKQLRRTTPPAIPKKGVKELPPVIKGKGPPSVPGKVASTVDQVASEVSTGKVWANALDALVKRPIKDAKERVKRLEQAFLDGDAHIKAEGKQPTTKGKAMAKGADPDAVDAAQEARLKGQPTAEGVVGHGELATDRAKQHQLTIRNLFSSKADAIGDGADVHELTKWDGLIELEARNIEGMASDAGGTLQQTVATRRAFKLIRQAEQDLYKQVRRLGPNAKPEAVEKLMSKHKEYLENFKFPDPNATPLLATAANTMNRVMLDNLLSFGTLKTVAISNVMTGGYEALIRGLREPLSAPKAFWHLGGDMLGSIKMGLSPSTWRVAWAKGLSNTRGRFTDEVAEHMAPGKLSVVKGLVDRASNTSYTLLGVADDTFNYGIQSVVSKNAIKRWVDEMLERGASAKSLENTIKSIMDGTGADVGLQRHLVNAFDDAFDRLAMRSGRMDEYAPMVARPLWYMHDWVKKARETNSAFGSALRTVAVFTRAGANTVDYMARNSALRLLDVGFHRRVRGLELDRAVVGTAVSTGIGAAAGHTYLGISDLASMINPSVQQSPYNINTDSRRARAFGKKEGVHIGPLFVELRQLGPLGDYSSVQKAAMDTIQRLSIQGDRTEAEALSEELLNLGFKLYGENWAFSRLLPLLTALRAGGEDAIDQFPLSGEDFIPGKGLATRFITAMKGATPSGEFMEMMAELDEQVSVQAGPFGRRMNGTDQLTGFMEGDRGFIQSMLDNPVAKFLVPSGGRHFDRKTHHLANFLFEMGGFANNDAFYYRDSEGELQYLSGNQIDLQGLQEIRTVFTPLRKSVTYFNNGNYRLSELDMNQSRMLLSLDLDDARQVFTQWTTKVERLPGVQESPFFSAQIQQMRANDPLRALTELRESFEDAGMKKSEDLTDFFYRISNAPLGELGDIGQAISDERDNLMAYGLTTENGIEPSFAENLARKNIMANLWNNARAVVQVQQNYAPSVAMELLEVQGSD